MGNLRLIQYEEDKIVPHPKHKRNPSIPVLRRHSVVLICAVLAIVTIAAYWPVLGCGFLNYDDDSYVTENPYVLEGLSLEGIQWAFLSVGYSSNWHPLTWLSHMLDCQLFGQHAGLHHLTNLLIHTANVMLLLWVLVSMTGRLGPSAFVAAVFAIHPLHVESVAWIAERKDVLSTLFWFLTMACYLRYTRTRSRSSYLATLFSFGLGLLAKPMLVTLPFVLLLLDFWPLNRFDRGSARYRIAEKIPFFILSAASCTVTFLAQKAGGAFKDFESLSFIARLSNAMVSYIVYIVKMVWPVRLTVLYPLRQIPLWQFILSLTALVIVTVIALLLIRRKRYVAVGWLWYIGTLVPVIGFVQVGNQSLADRYTYIPLIGLFIIVAWAISDICQKRPTLRSVSAGTAILLLAAMFAGTRNQLQYWKDSISLSSHAIKVTENNVVMRINLGNAAIDAGQWDEAIVQYRHLLEINPDNADVCINLGYALLKTGQLDEAIVHFRHALQIDPDNADACNNLGLALSKTGLLNEAIIHYRRGLQIDPDNVKIYNNLGYALLKTGQLDEAIVQYRHVLQNNPDDAMSHYHLGNMLADQGHLSEAITHYRRLIELQPEHLLGLNNLAWILATAGDPMLRNPTEAVFFAEKGNELTAHENTMLLDTLAVAYASAERFDKAVSTAEKVLELAAAAGNENLVQEIRGRLKLFREGRSYIEKPLMKDMLPEK